jgi:protein TonB
MSAYYPQQEASLLSKRALVFLVILVIHAIVIYAFASGLAKSGQRYLQSILQTNIIQTEKQKDLPPPPPPVDLKEKPPVQVIAPDINISVPVDLPPPITNVVKAAPPPPPPAVVRPPPPGTPVQVTYRPDISNYYPESARREGQEGRVIGSGFEDLDQAALKVAKAYRFKAATSEGKPISVCPTLPVKFELHAGAG